MLYKWLLSKISVCWYRMASSHWYGLGGKKERKKKISDFKYIQLHSSHPWCNYIVKYALCVQPNITLKWPNYNCFFFAGCVVTFIVQFPRESKAAIWLSCICDVDKRFAIIMMVAQSAKHVTHSAYMPPKLGDPENHLDERTHTHTMYIVCMYINKYPS